MTEKGAGFVIAATGLRAEARIAARSGGVRAVAGGGDAARLDQPSSAIDCARRRGHSSASALPPVLHRNARRGPALSAARSFTAAPPILPTRVGPQASRELIGGADLVRSPASIGRWRAPQKSGRCHQATGAAAADMESHVVARLAAELGLPFAVLRVIADPAEREVPPAALAGMRADGADGCWRCARLAWREAHASCRRLFGLPRYGPRACRTTPLQRSVWGRDSASAISANLLLDVR